jgi:hypothetical protein
MAEFQVATTAWQEGDRALVSRGAGNATTPARVVIGSAATRNTGTAAGNVPVLDAGGKLPAEVLPGDGSGGAGADGREVELRANATHIQWRYVGEVGWTDLIELAELEGPAGPTGATGATGPAGATGAAGPAGADGSPDTGAQIVTKLEGQAGAERLNGAAVRQVVLRVVHGATASAPRPAGADFVEWVGSVPPTNAAENDTWRDTAP